MCRDKQYATEWQQRVMNLVYVEIELQNRIRPVALTSDLEAGVGSANEAGMPAKEQWGAIYSVPKLRAR